MKLSAQIINVFLAYCSNLRCGWALLQMRERFDDQELRILEIHRDFCC